MRFLSANRMKLLVASALLAALVVSRPFLAGETTSFDHKVHLDEGAECSVCHALDETRDHMAVNPEGCKECHDEEIPGYVSRKVAPGAFLFSHKLHVEAAECMDCHKATAEDRAPTGGTLMTETTCRACHQENGIEVARTHCNRCHGKSAGEILPADHAGTWLMRHGKESRWRVFEKHGQNCNQCHGSDSCLTCHKSRRPRSHTGLWRLRTHGASASWDRNSCKTCHETGTCIACHKTTRPINHVGNWGSPNPPSGHARAARSTMDDSCNVCHHQAECMKCHGSGR